MSCKVYGCRHLNDHCTIMHQCGKCKLFGHGQRECGSLKLMDSLEVYKSERFTDSNNHCKVINCDEPDTHTTNGHCCMYCGKRDEQHLKRCPKVGGEYITDPLSIGFDPRGVGESQELDSGTFTYFYGGMGCQWYIRNNNGTIEYFFLHSDEVGQYGPDTSSIPCLVAFTHKYKRVEFRTN
jgi:hypothetical protein